VESILLDNRGSFAWIADPGETLLRASTAIAVGDGCLVVDPVETPGLHDELAAIGPVRAVCSLLDRHARDARAVAAVHGAPVVLPLALGGDGVAAAVAGIEERTVVRTRLWKEALLWVPDRHVLVCGDALGRLPYFLANDDEAVGMHPFLRPWPPRGAFAGLDPRTIAVGHGRPVLHGATHALNAALKSARRGLAGALARTGLAAARRAAAGRRRR
jgi:hypothetical protein